jgi:hypothetical protein
MKLFEFKKYFFDIFSEEANYLFFFISILKIGKTYNSYIQIQYARPDSSGKYSLNYSLKAKLKLIDSQLNQITFFEGVINFEEESIIIYIATPSYKIDLNYTTAHLESNIINPLFIKTSENTSLSWIPVQIKALVNGSISTTENVLNYNNASGYIDLVKTSILPFNLHIQKLLWGRLHHEKVDMTYSLIIDENNKSESLLILHFKSMNIEFRNIEYQVLNEKINPDLNITYPDKIILTAKNETYCITLEIIDHKEVIINEFMDPGDQYNKAFFWIMRRMTKNPKGIKFLAKANIFLEESLNKSVFHNLSLIDEFVYFCK